MQLAEYNERFEKLGYHLATVTYEDHDKSLSFHRRQNLPFPILKDEQSGLIKLLGILNRSPHPGDRYYGIPYPGIFLVDQQGIIKAKFSEQDFRDRPDLNHVLEAAGVLANIEG